MLGAALCFHLITLVGYRLIATQVGIGPELYYIVHALWAVTALNYLRLSDFKWFEKNDIHRWFRFNNILAYGLALFGVGVIFFLYQVHPIQDYYQDEHQRMSIAHFIKLAYPPPEFHVFSDSTYRYYNFTELLTTNISQFTGIEIGRVYFHFILWLNWSLIAIGFLSLVNYDKLRSPIISLGLFFVFFLIHGAAGPQKISHFTFHQNTLALAMLFLSAYFMLMFFHAKKVIYFLLSIIMSSLIVATKLAAYVPMMFVIPIAGFWAYYKKYISFYTLIGSGLLSMSLTGLWYYIVVYNPAPSAQVTLNYDPNHWLVTGYINNILAYPTNLFQPAQEFIGKYNSFLLFYHLEWIVMAVCATFLGRRSNSTSNPAGWMLLGGCIISFYIFANYLFSNSQGSQVYFLFFASWLFSALSARYIVSRLNDSYQIKAMLVTVILVFTLSMNSYAYKDIRHFSGPVNTIRHTENEMRAFKLLREKTDPDAWVLHNYYKIGQIWSFASLSARRSVLTSFYPGAVNQDKRLYSSIRTEVDKFYDNKMSKQEILSFLNKYNVQAVWNLKRLGDSPDLSQIGFKAIQDDASLVLWVR